MRKINIRFLVTRLDPYYQLAMEWAFHRLEFFCMRLSNLCITPNARIQFLYVLGHVVVSELKVEQLLFPMKLWMGFYEILTRWLESTVFFCIEFITIVKLISWVDGRIQSCVITNLPPFLSYVEVFSEQLFNLVLA